MSTTTEFYEIHAQDFSRSRYRIWPSVASFLDALPSNSTVLDIGCGNGKNMIHRQDLTMVGLEQSKALCDICINRNLNVVQGSALSLPFKDNTFDAIIMIAVIHHIHPEEQIKVLEEIQRVLKPSANASALITNWAVEQPDDGRRTFVPGLNMVKWKGKEIDPLPYWVMNKEMAEEFSQKMPEGIKCKNLSWGGGNWEFIIQKS